MNGGSVFIAIMEVLPGTFRLECTGLSPGQVILAGAAVEYNEATRTAKVICCAKCAAGIIGRGLVYEDTTAAPGASVIIVTRAIVNAESLPDATTKLQAFLPKIVSLKPN